MVTRKQAHDRFIAEFEKFLTATASVGSIVTSREIKLWVKGLPREHPLKTSYNRYVELCGHYVELRGSERTAGKWGLDDFNRIANHMKYVSGYQRQFAYTKRYETGAQTRFVKVYKNIIKL
jgi:hypothetical protein